MSREEILQKVNNIFHEAFDDDSLVIGEKTRASDIEGWDSLRNITLLESVEDTFSIRFKMAEVGEMQNVGDMMNIIEARVQK